MARIAIAIILAVFASLAASARAGAEEAPSITNAPASHEAEAIVTNAPVAPEAAPAMMNSPAQPNVQGMFLSLIADAERLFAPLASEVRSVEGDALISDIHPTSGLQAAEGLVPGMRLDILRKGEAFIHPITGERIGSVEGRVGRAEIREVLPEGTRLRLVSGEARPGDIVRRSAAPVRALFYQKSGVDWDLAEEYYLQLKDSKRFEISDSAPGDDSADSIVRKARQAGAEAAIVLDQRTSPSGVIITQSILYAEDGASLAASSLDVPQARIPEFKLGETAFMPDPLAPVISYTFPFTTRGLGVGDLDGDGAREIFVYSGGRVHFYSSEFAIIDALGGLTLDVAALDTVVWLDALDFDADGSEELMVSTLSPVSAVTYVYSFRAGAFELRTRAEMFLRAFDGLLMAERFSPYRGYEGGVFEASPEAVLRGEKPGASAAPIALPAGVHLYEFALIPGPAGPGEGGHYYIAAHDKGGRIALYDSQGARLWESAEDYSRFERLFQSGAMGGAFPDAEISLPDRIAQIGGAVFAVNRTPYLKTSGLLSATVQHAVFRENRLMRLRRTGEALEESVAVSAVPGKVMDFVVSGDRLYVITDSWSVTPFNLLKGESPFNTKLSVYQLTGGGAAK